MRTELTITVTEFKAKCLGIIDRVNTGELSRVRLTRRGKVVAELASLKEDEKEPYRFDLEEFRASLGTDRLEYDPTFDGGEPFLDEESLAEWEAGLDALGGSGRRNDAV